MALPIIDRAPEPDDATAAIDLTEEPLHAAPLSLRRRAAERTLTDDVAWVRCRSCGMDVRTEQLGRHRDTQH